jgi:hypothetical protein
MSNKCQFQLIVFLLSLFVFTACRGAAMMVMGEMPQGGSNAYQLQPQAILLDGLPIKIVHVDDETIVIKGQVKGIEPGKILISSEGDGFLRKVISVKKTRDGLSISTTQASLSEGFSTLNFKHGATIGTTPPGAAPSSPPRH